MIRWPLLIVLGAIAPSLAYAQDKKTCFDAAEIGQAQRDAHYLLEARAALRTCASQSCPAAVRKDCTSWLEATEEAMPSVVVTAVDERGDELADAHIQLDGADVQHDGRAIDVNPGWHTAVLRAASGARIEARLMVVEGNRKKPIELVLKPAAIPIVVAPPPPATQGIASPSATPSPGASPQVPTEPHGAIPAQRIAGYGAVGLGAVGLVVGTIFELQRSSKLSDRDAICPSGVGCTLDQKTRVDGLTSDARTASTAGLVSLVAGCAMVAGGFVLVVTAPQGSSESRVSARPVIGPRFSGFALSGSF